MVSDLWVSICLPALVSLVVSILSGFIFRYWDYRHDAKVSQPVLSLMGVRNHDNSFNFILENVGRSPLLDLRLEDSERRSVPFYSEDYINTGNPHGHVRSTSPSLAISERIVVLMPDITPGFSFVYSSVHGVIYRRAIEELDGRYKLAREIDEL